MSPKSAHDSWQPPVLPHLSKGVLRTLTYRDQGSAEKKDIISDNTEVSRPDTN